MDKHVWRAVVDVDKTKHRFVEITGFRRGLGEEFGLLGCCTVKVCSCLSAFLHKTSLPSSRVKDSAKNLSVQFSKLQALE